MLILSFGTWNFVEASTKLLRDNTSTTYRQNHSAKNFKNKAGKCFLHGQIAQSFLYLITICFGWCSTPWPRNSSKTTTKSKFWCPTSSSRSRPSSWSRAFIFFVDVAEKSLIMMVNIFWVNVPLFYFYTTIKFLRKSISNLTT